MTHYSEERKEAINEAVTIHEYFSFKLKNDLKKLDIKLGRIERIIYAKRKKDKIDSIRDVHCFGYKKRVLG